jgi:hypothetical protein
MMAGKELATIEGRHYATTLPIGSRRASSPSLSKVVWNTTPGPRDLMPPNCCKVPDGMCQDSPRGDLDCTAADGRTGHL